MKTSTENPPRCALCGSQRFAPLGDWGFVMGVCGDCGLVYMHPVNWAALRDLYENRYRYARLGRDPFPPPSPWDRERFGWVDGCFSENPGRRLRVLEIGCGAGKLLELFAASSRWEAVGVEPDKRSCAHARERRGLDVRNGFLQEASLPEKYFDAAVMISVFEHFERPVEALAQVRAALGPGGKLFVEVPNAEHPHGFFIDRTWRGYRPTPEHLFCYSPATLRAMLARGGFAMESLKASRENLRAEAAVGEVRGEKVSDGVRKVVAQIGAFGRRARLRAPMDVARRAAEELCAALLPGKLVDFLRKVRRGLNRPRRVGE